MSIRSTITDFEIPRRNGYGIPHGTHIIDVHVFTTITHDVVGIELAELTHAGSWNPRDRCEVVLTEIEANQLIAAIQAAIDDNKNRSL